ncbi:TIGR00282 family metallophosphoesterase [Acidobacteriota bacterium]
MNILFIGDIVGKPGRRILLDLLDNLKRENEIAFTLANAENAAGGVGLNPELADELLHSGIDLLTSGNHVFRYKEIFEYMERENRLIRPLNYPPGAPGKGMWTGKISSGDRISVINLQGRTFMDPVDCPFRAADDALGQLNHDAKIKLVDFHAEATSEKTALGWHLNGSVSAVIGTHTHIQTADERVLSRGTAYITDAGMTGAIDSVIGVEIKSALDRFLTGLHHRFKPAKNNPRLNGVVISIDRKTGNATAIKRVNCGLP